MDLRRLLVRKVAGGEVPCVREDEKVSAVSRRFASLGRRGGGTNAGCIGRSGFGRFGDQRHRDRMETNYRPLDDLLLILHSLFLLLEAGEGFEGCEVLQFRPLRLLQHLLLRHLSLHLLRSWNSRLPPSLPLLLLLPLAVLLAQLLCRPSKRSRFQSVERFGGDVRSGFFRTRQM